jgi:hypothetical protein
MQQPDPNALVIDPVQVIAWVHAHKWAPVIAVLVGLLVRLVKDDTQLGAALPAVWRPYWGLLVSFVLTGATAVVGGIAWQSVIENSAIAFIVAVLGHQTFIEGMRNGVEIKVPFLTKPAPSNVVSLDEHRTSTLAIPPPPPHPEPLPPEPPKAA